MISRTAGPTAPLLAAAGMPPEPHATTQAAAVPLHGSNAPAGNVGAFLARAAFGIDEAAAYCDLSRAMWMKLRAQGRVPHPIKLGRRTLWPAAELRAWLLAGAPPAALWASIRVDWIGGDHGR